MKGHPTDVIQCLKNLVRSVPWSACRLDVEASGGVRFRVRDRSEWYLFQDIFLRGEYDDAIQAACRAAPLDRRATVVDLGANGGLFSLRVCEQWKLAGLPTPNFYAVEANASLIPRLQERLPADARVVLGLAGERSGAAGFEVNDNPASSRVSSEGRRQVRYADLEGIIGRQTPVDLLKCDIEGSEEALSKSYPSLLARTRVAVFEMHGELCDVAATRGRLGDAGLRQVGVRRVGGDLTIEWFERDRNGVPK